MVGVCVISLARLEITLVSNDDSSGLPAEQVYFINVRRLD